MMDLVHFSCVHSPRNLIASTKKHYVSIFQTNVTAIIGSADIAGSRGYKGKRIVNYSNSKSAAKI